ncbi:MAG: hypothetical protein JJU36_12655, partial [Phycisphaeraceae bacterium]|nr:hypothetical protein [Phycisphaeraceae bacterium]
MKTVNSARRGLILNHLTVWSMLLVVLPAFLIGPMVAPVHAEKERSEMRDVPHPFLLWTPEEAKAIRQRIENDEGAKKQLEFMRSNTVRGGHQTLYNLFAYMVLGDEEAGEREKQALLRFIGGKPEPMTWGIDLDKLEWHIGGPSRGDRHMRDEQTLNVLRYDVLYPILSDEQRKGIQEAMRNYIRFHLSGHQPWHPHFRYDRMSWLPNMHWPRAIGTHLMAVALKDEDLIRKMFESKGGFKFKMDDYLCKDGFYMEEFGKYYSNVGTMLMYCEGLERLGLGKYGYGYTGKHGATMKKHLWMPITIAYPKMEGPEGGTPSHLAVSMGDASDFWLLQGRDRQGRWRQRWFSSAHMNGPLPKLNMPLWFEIGHRRFPDAGFDYFLAKLRGPDEDTYHPTLYFGLEPIKAAEVADRAPAVSSVVSHDRGFALLRMDETPDYWESARPAVSLQFAMYYVHYVHDCFSLLQYVSHNRLLYHRMGTTQRGYAGGDSWRDSVRGHSGVVVDGLQAKPVDRGNEGTPNHRIRDFLKGPGRLVSVQAEGVYPDVNQTRAFFLTDEYLLDTFELISDRPRTYDWQVLAVGNVRQTDGWTPAADWSGSRPAERLHLSNTMARQTDGDWYVDVLQDDSPYAEPRQVGVRIRMLPEPETMILTSRPPIGDNEEGASVMVSRKSPRTVFVALHEPFEGGQAANPTFERIKQDENVLAVRIVGEGDSKVNDRALLALEAA